MKTMKKALIILLALVLALSCAACGKSKEVQNVEKLIEEIGETISLNSQAAIEAAENAFESLSDKEKEAVSNVTVLTEGRKQFDALIEAERERQYAEDLDAVALQVYGVDRALGNAGYMIYTVIDNIGSEDWDLYLAAVRVFNEDQPLSYYKEMLGDAYETVLLGACWALEPEYVKNGSFNSDVKRSEFLHTCIQYNGEYDWANDHIDQAISDAEAFADEHEAEHRKDSEMLKAYCEELRSYYDKIMNPSGTVLSYLETLSDCLSDLMTYSDYFGVTDRTDYKY